MCTKTTKDWVRLIRVYTGRFECDHSNRIRPLSQQAVVSAAHLLAHTLFTTDTTARWPQTLHCFCCYVHHTASISELVWALPLSLYLALLLPTTQRTRQSLHLSHCLSVDGGRDVPSVGRSAPHTHLSPGEECLLGAQLHTHTSPQGKNACGVVDAQHRPSLGVIRA